MVGWVAPSMASKNGWRWKKREREIDRETERETDREKAKEI